MASAEDLVGSFQFNNTAGGSLFGDGSGLSLISGDPTPYMNAQTVGYGTAPQAQTPTYQPDYAAAQARQAAAQDAALRQQQSGLINQIFDSRIGRLRSVFDRVPTQQDQALNQYNSVYDQNLQQLNNSAEQGRNNLKFQEETNTKNKARSFRDIAQGIRGTLDSAANRLGAMNATDSSASPMLAYALANLQAQQRGQANETYGTNAQQIGMARTNMENDFQMQLNGLQTEKRNKIQEIANQFAQTRQQILDEIANSDEQRAQELASVGQQYTMRALSDIQALEDQYSQASQSWVQNALGSMPKVNTAAFNPNIEAQSYGTYGRGAPIQDNATAQQMTESFGVPLRRNEDQFSF